MGLLVLAQACSARGAADAMPAQRAADRAPAQPWLSGGAVGHVGGGGSDHTAGPSGAGAGGASGDAPATELNDDNATTARGVAVALDVTANDGALPPSFIVTVASAPKHGVAEPLPEHGRIRYSPVAGFVGGDSFEYTIAASAEDEESPTAKVTIDIADRDWLLVDGAAYELAPVSAPGLDVAEPVRFFDLNGENVSLQVGRTGLEQAFTFDLSSSAMTSLGIAPARAYHFASNGVLAGTRAEQAAHLGVLWLPGRVIEVAYPGAASTELFGINGSGVAVGSAAGGLLPPGESRAFQYRLHSKQLEPVVLPEGNTNGTALGIDDAGNVVGSAAFDGSERAYISTNDGPRWLTLGNSVWSRAYDLRASGEVVGMGRMAGRLAIGFLAKPDGQVAWVEHPSGVSTWLLGVGDSGELAGSFLDPHGQTRPFLARPLAPHSAVGSFSWPTEPVNAALAHACTHGLEGPFRVLTATSTPASAPTFETPHTSYTVLLSGADEGQVRYRALAPGPFSFFVHPPAALRVYAPDGSELLPKLVRRTELCPKISWTYQLQAPVAGDYRVVIGPAPLEKVFIILERSWAFEE